MNNNSKKKTTVARYLVQRLQELGLDHFFCVPGNFLGGLPGRGEGLLDVLGELKDEITYVGSTNETNAGYAVDGYARIRGIGAVGVTYGVGALSLLNPIGGSFVERVPIVVINGSPSRAERLTYEALGVLAIHMISNKQSNLNAFREVTVASQVIDNGYLAPGQIDSALTACLTDMAPVYLEFEHQVWEQECDAPVGKILPRPTPSSSELENAVEAVVELIRSKGAPVFWGGVEIARFNLRDEFQKLVESSEIPFMTTAMGKSILSEEHPLFRGVYNGNRSIQKAKDFFDKAGCQIGVGVWTTAWNLGGAEIWGEKLVIATNDGVKVGSQYFPDIRLSDLISKLTTKLTSARSQKMYQPYAAAAPQYTSAQLLATDALTFDAVFESVNNFINDGSEPSPYVVVSDAGFCLFCANTLQMKEPSTFFSQSSWLAIGYSVPAVTGVKAALPDKRPIVLVGDGAFQQTCQALSNHVRLNQNPIILLLDNSIYGIEQMLINPEYFAAQNPGPLDEYNILHHWEYTKLTEVFGGVSYKVETRQQLDEALQEIANQNPQQLTLVQVVIPEKNYPVAIGSLVPN